MSFHDNEAFIIKKRSFNTTIFMVNHLNQFCKENGVLESVADPGFEDPWVPINGQNIDIILL